MARKLDRYVKLDISWKDRIMAFFFGVIPMVVPDEVNSKDALVLDGLTNIIKALVSKSVVENEREQTKSNITKTIETIKEETKDIDKIEIPFFDFAETKVKSNL